MARKPKKSTLQELRQAVRDDLKRWNHVYRRGTADPHWPDGTNLDLIRNHVWYNREQLRKRCREDQIRPCPKESKTKLPKEVSQNYCAPKSKAGPCKERRQRAAARKRRGKRFRKKAKRRTRKQKK